MEFSQFNPIKCFVHSEKIKSILRGEFPPPVVLNLDLTNKCNYRCCWCYVDSFIHGSSAELSFDTASRIIKEAADFGVKSILFTGGGEPLKHPQFIKIAQVAADCGLQLGLTTNGSLLHTVKRSIPYDWFKYIRISFDAGCSATYQNVHQSIESAFHNVLNAAYYISNNKNSECQLGMAFLATPFNYKEIPLAVELAEQYGFDYISIRPAVLRATLSKKQLQEAIEICASLQSNRIKILALKPRFDSLAKPKQFACRATPLVAIVTADAKFNLCCQHRCNPKFQWGNLNENSFEELWGNKKHLQLVSNIDSSKCPLCRMVPYNEIIQKAFVQDEMHLNFI